MHTASMVTTLRAKSPVLPTFAGYQIPAASNGIASTSEFGSANCGLYKGVGTIFLMEILRNICKHIFARKVF